MPQTAGGETAGSPTARTAAISRHHRDEIRVVSAGGDGTKTTRRKRGKGAGRDGTAGGTTSRSQTRTFLADALTIRSVARPATVSAVGAVRRTDETEKSPPPHHPRGTATTTAATVVNATSPPSSAADLPARATRGDAPRRGPLRAALAIFRASWTTTILAQARRRRTEAGTADVRRKRQAMSAQAE